MELELACYEVCPACRGTRTLWVPVDERMRSSLWGDDDSLVDVLEAPQKRRLPALQAFVVVWTVPIEMLVPVLPGAPLLSGVEKIKLTGITLLRFPASPIEMDAPRALRQPRTAMAHSPL